MIRTINISKIYNENKDNEVKALTDVNIEIEKGEFIAISGISGSGKSTLLNIIGCMDSPTYGEYFFDGIEIGKASGDKLAEIRNARIGFVLQDNALLNNESVFANVRLPLIFSKKFKIKEHKKRVNDILEMLNIGALAKKKVRELSGGQRQRAAIARAMVNEPDIIMADEPTSALDSKTAYEILDVFKSLNESGVTVIIVTHDKKVMEYASRIITIVDGEIAVN